MVFRRPESDSLRAAATANRKAVEEARQTIRKQAEANSLLEMDQRAAMELRTRGAEPALEQTEDNDPDFWPPHVPRQYHQTGALNRLWLALVGLFT